MKTKKNKFLTTTSIIIAVVAIIYFDMLTFCSDAASQERQARATVKAAFRRAPEGDSYKPIAWGYVEVNSAFAGTGTKNPILGKTDTPPSAYSIPHRLRMHNGFGNVMTFDVRVFFTNESCTEWAGMEYMDVNDLTRYSMKNQIFMEK